MRSPTQFLNTADVAPSHAQQAACQVTTNPARAQPPTMLLSKLSDRSGSEVGNGTTTKIVRRAIATAFAVPGALLAQFLAQPRFRADVKAAPRSSAEPTWL